MVTPKIDVNGLAKRDAERKRAKKKERVEITFGEYLKLLEDDPQIAQNAYSRHEENVLAAGVEDIPEDEQWDGATRRFLLFSRKLYGKDRVVQDIMNYVEAGKRHAAVAKQALLIIGPPGVGKSTIVDTFAEALEETVRPVYAIKGCPRNEEPLHLLPRYLREEIEKKLGVKIEGDLCPPCRDHLFKKFQDEDGAVRWKDVPVVPFAFSIQDGRGISAFEPSGEKSEDISKLTGSENLGVTQDPDRGKKDPYAYELTGAIPQGERGLVQGIEVLSTGDPDVLGVLFSVGEERRFKVPNSPYPHISVDTLIIGHTNLTPFKKFAGNKDFEGLHKRFYVVLNPNNVRVKDEVALYRKLINAEDDYETLKKCHIAPGALELAALFAVMTRLVRSQKGIGLLTKAKVYNGDMLLTELEDKDTRPHDIGELREEGQSPNDVAKKEGMFGVDSRDVLAALNTAMIEELRGGKCLTPLTVIAALRKVFKDGHRMGCSPEEIDEYLSLLQAGEEESVMTEHRDLVQKIVNSAFLSTNPDLAPRLFERYMNEIAFLNRTTSKFVHDLGRKIERDKATGKPKEPDMKFILSIEQHMSPPWGEHEAKQGRSELLAFRDSITFESYGSLRKAVERKLLAENKDILRAVLARDHTLSEEEERRRGGMNVALKEKYECCDTCLDEILEKAGEYQNE